MEPVTIEVFKQDGKTRLIVDSEHLPSMRHIMQHSENETAWWMTLFICAMEELGKPLIVIDSDMERNREGRVIMIPNENGSSIFDWWPVTNPPNLPFDEKLKGLIYHMVSDRWAEMVSEPVPSIDEIMESFWDSIENLASERKQVSIPTSYRRVVK